MVVADDHTLTSIFPAHHISRDRFRYDACVGEREVFGDDASPAVRAKFNRTHASEYTRGSTGRNSRIGLLKGKRDWTEFVAIRASSSFSALRAISQSCRRLVPHRADKLAAHRQFRPPPGLSPRWPR